jgi:hypothetical protein
LVIFIRKRAAARGKFCPLLPILAQYFDPFPSKKPMNSEEKNPKHNLAEEAQEYNASLGQGPVQKPDAPTMGDQRTNVNTENLTQSASGDREVAPEFGDAADPTSEELGTHHRDE